MMRKIWPLDPATYVRHPLHDGDRAWNESNCYVDLWIELLHTAGFEPLAALPFTFAVDVEGDQWTFFKFPLADLNALYGVDVIELQVWRPITAHLEEQLAIVRDRKDRQARVAIAAAEHFHLLPLLPLRARDRRG